MTEADWSGDGAAFIRAFLEEDDETLDKSVERLGTLRGVILMSSLLSVLLREKFGVSIALEKLSGYAKEIFLSLDQKPRRIVIERVLRTGAGHEGSLSGLSEDEILESTVAVLRWMCRESRDRNSDNSLLVDRAVRLARDGTIIG